VNEKLSGVENCSVIWEVQMLLYVAHVSYRKLHQLQHAFPWRLEAIGEKKHIVDFKCFSGCVVGRLLVFNPVNCCGKCAMTRCGATVK